MSQATLFPGGLQESGAMLSEDRQYRYALWRRWDPMLPDLNVIGLNPSTADEFTDDPTIRRCVGFARAWGCGGLVMTNLFGYRATDPGFLWKPEDPVGPLNDYEIVERARQAARTIAAWGVHGNLLARDVTVMQLLEARSIWIGCLGTTKDGFPRHPLYVRADTPCVPYTGRR